MQFWEANLRVLLDFVSGPLGVIAVMLLLGAALAAIVSPSMRVIALVFYFLILFVGPVPELADGSALAYKPILQPFAFFRQNSRALMTLSFIVVVPVVLLWGRPIMQRSRASILYLILQVVWSFFQYVYGGSILKIILGMLLFTGCWLVATGRPMRTVQDWYDGWKVVIWALLAFIGCHVILLVLGSPGMYAAGTRLQGMTSNPQFTAQNLAIGCIILAALAADGEFRRATRMPVWFVWVTVAIAASMLGMTGSRGGALFAAVGLVVLFGANIGRAALFLVPAGIFVYFIGTAFFFVDKASGVSLDRIFSGDDTRSQLIVNLFYRWMRNPILGEAGDMSSGYNECLYLYVPMRLGVFALMYLLWMVGQAMWQTYRGARQARHRRGVVHRLPMAIVVSMCVQNITEAGLLSQFTISTTMFLMCCELGTAAHLLTDSAEEPQPELEYFADGPMLRPAF